MGYIKGALREQGVLFPATLEEYIDENNEVRAIAAFIEYMPFEELGFVRSEAADTGRPGYDPRMLLGLYIWGHLNRVRSSRRLERESGRNVELMWLTGMLKPDFKTLCRFRRDNGTGIEEVVARFRAWCEGAGLYGKELVAIDGSKFKAVNSAGRNMTQKKLEKLMERERAAARRYLAELEEADERDEAEGEERRLTAEELRERIEGIAGHLKEQQALLEEMKERGEKQRSLTDPDSRMMKTAKGMQVSYNVQAAVDAKYKLIAAVEVTNEAADQEQLPDMAKRAKEGLNVEELTVVADGGYYGCEAIKACEDEGVTAYVPVRESATAENLGVFPTERFSYDEERDAYVCPAGKELKPVSRSVQKARYRKEYRVYGTKECESCPLRMQCTTSKYGRKIKRWVHHEVLDRLRARLRDNPEILRQRKSLVEHPFGTIKVAMDHERLLMKGLKHVGTEIKLTVLCYNFKRVMSILGIETMIEMLKTGKNPAIQLA